MQLEPLYLRYDYPEDEWSIIDYHGSPWWLDTWNNPFFADAKDAVVVFPDTDIGFTIQLIRRSYLLEPDLDELIQVLNCCSQYQPGVKS